MVSAKGVTDDWEIIVTVEEAEARRTRVTSLLRREQARALYRLAATHVGRARPGQAVDEE